MTKVDAAVIGAGVAGLAAAIALRRRGYDVCVLERSAGRPSRFCGEFVAGEALASLAELGAAGRLQATGPAVVRRTRLVSPRGSSFEMPLPSGGWGLSRQALDGGLQSLAIDLGVEFATGTAVTALGGDAEHGFLLTALSKGEGRPRRYAARAVVAAWGKRSGLDRALGRRFFARPSGWIGIREKFWAPGFGDSVDLHFLPGGYCGAVAVEGGRVNLCMLARQQWLDEACGDPARVVQTVIRRAPDLQTALAGAQRCDGTLQTIVRVPFFRKQTPPVGVFGAGDAAGVVAPFLGAGVANGLRSGLAAATFLDQGLRDDDLPRAHRRYHRWWRSQFGTTQIWSRTVSAALSRGTVSEALVRALPRAPGLAEQLYRISRAQSYEWGQA